MKLISSDGSDRPNVLVIISDDLGYADLGVNGVKDIDTPYIDSIAENGISFSNAYVTAPVCLPSRMGVVTGRYQENFGVQTLGGPTRSEDLGMPTSEKTIGDYFLKNGYATGAVGKWHMGWKPRFQPYNRGFEECLGFLGGGMSYMPDVPGNVLRNGKPEPKQAYLTDVFGTEAVEFIERHADEPWLLYLCFNAVHVPMEATLEYLYRYRHIGDPGRRCYAAMTAAMDDNIGRVLQAIRKTGKLDNTIIIFTNDNGGAPSNFSSNAPYREGKYLLYEGGIRVPFFVQWPAVLKSKGKVIEDPIIAIDILPTVLSAVGIKPDASAKLDGVDLMPLLQGKKWDVARRLYWRYGPYMAAMRDGDWKIIKSGMGENRNPEWELYDLSEDPGESHDLADEQPERVKQMSENFSVWDDALPEPLFVDQRLVDGIIWWGDRKYPMERD